MSNILCSNSSFILTSFAYERHCSIIVLLVTYYLTGNLHIFPFPTFINCSSSLLWFVCFIWKFAYFSFLFLHYALVSCSVHCCYCWLHVFKKIIVWYFSTILYPLVWSAGREQTKIKLSFTLTVSTLLKYANARCWFRPLFFAVSRNFRPFVYPIFFLQNEYYIYVLNTSNIIPVIFSADVMTRFKLLK